MFTNTRLFLNVLAVTLFAGCYSHTPKQSKTDFEAFPVEKKLDEVELRKIDEFTPDFIDLHNDSILYFVSANGEKRYHFALYHLQEKTFLHPLLPAGRKEGQALGFHSYGFENNYLWVYDVNKEKITCTGLDSLRDTSSNHFIKELPAPGHYYSVQLLNDSTLLTSGNYDAKDDYKIATINLMNGQISNQMTPYAPDSSASFNRAQKMAYESFLFVRPSKDKCVLASRYTDRIEIIDLNSRKSIVVKGTEGFEPEMKVVSGRDGRKISISGPNTRQAFVRGEVTNNFIYLLYSGNVDGTKHLFYGKYIYVYDWDGKPVQRLELANDVKDFAVTRNDSLLYTYNPLSKFISVAKLTK
ncbi:hypothetical protein A3860_21495 [Niastella vici]|uniref:Uncharacterized protein n=1 Tax=Niastella vici TaxID=1703345 RepID=A0A1V9G0E6_9BACT|nr:BF3164 family lipoprotein [Niastella vici]OQP63998.1 hypothetical protein A3860_21495 [Niastella vici]